MIPSFVVCVIDCLEIRSKFMGSRFRVSPSGVVPFDYVRKRFSGFYRFKRFKGVGAAHKNQKRRGDLKLAFFSYRKPNP